MNGLTVIQQLERLEPLGYYKWRAVFADGSIFDQFTPEGEEISVDRLRESPVPLRHILMIPRKDGYPLLCLEIRDGDEWVKKWIRTITVDFETETQVEQPTIDCIGIKPKGSDRWVYTYVYFDGSVKTTSNPEP